MKFRDYLNEQLENDNEFKIQFDALEHEYNSIREILNEKIKLEEIILKILDESKDLTEAKEKIRDLLK